MGWRFRKRVKIAPGVNMNISQRGLGMSVGGKYGRVSVSPTGRVTGTQSIPGTGLYHQQTLTAPKSRQSSARVAPNIVIIKQSQPLLLRLLYFIMIGWWATLFWWALALVLMCTLIGIPLGLRMIRATGTVLTLA